MRDRLRAAALLLPWLAAGCGRDPAAGELLAAQALSALEAGDPAGAARRAAEAVAAAPASPLAAEAAGRAALAQGHCEDAVRELNRAVQLGDQARRRGLVGEAYLACGKLDAAADAVEAGLAQAPSDPALLRQAVFVYSRVGRIDEAQALADKVLKLEPGNPRTMVRVASAWLRANKVEEARALLRTVEPGALETPEDLAMLGACMYDLGEAARAVAALEAANAKGPGMPDLLYNLGSAYLLAERYPDALRAFEKSLALAPKDAKAKGQVAYCLNRMGRAESARRMLAEARRDDPGDPVLEMLAKEIEGGAAPGATREPESGP